jgi:uncharacterized protein (TIGR03435 family)
MIFTAVCSLTTLGIAFAQDSRPAFEVASVKRNTSNDHTGYGNPSADRFNAVNTGLKTLISIAWKLPVYEVFNAPAWVEEERYDIDARAAESPFSADRLRLMLQSLLAERFNLAAHPETREESVYALVAAKGGIKAAESRAGNCQPYTPGQPPPVRQPGDPEPPPPCGALNIGANHLSGFRITPEMMARGLSALLGRPVLDQTGYTKAFDFSLEFKMDGVAAWEAGGFGRPELSVAGADDNLPTIFTALQEKLGFTLQTQKAPVDVLVVDHIEKLKEN